MGRSNGLPELAYVARLNAELDSLELALDRRRAAPREERRAASLAVEAAVDRAAATAAEITETKPETLVTVVADLEAATAERYERLTGDHV